MRQRLVLDYGNSCGSKVIYKEAHDDIEAGLYLHVDWDQTDVTIFFSEIDWAEELRDILNDAIQKRRDIEEEELEKEKDPWLCMPWVSPHDEVYYGVKESHERAKRLYKEYDGDVEKYKRRLDNGQ